MKRIIIIDDNRSFLDELQETLDVSGYQTIGFTEGASALAAVQDASPDLVLLDLNMKGMNGFQIADRLRRSAATISTPIIAITGYVSDEDHTRLVNDHAITACLKKPFPMEALMSLIERSIAQMQQKGPDPRKG